MANRYDYETLRKNALAENSTKEDRLALLEWCSEFLYAHFNGESYDIDNGLSLYPIYNEVEEGVFEVVDAEIR
ncbi:MAG: hypothetical protein IJ341_02410 [Bacteroidales bacterium]|nr:hypothetical protein [Bacteroidales bacterium]